MIGLTEHPHEATVSVTTAAPETAASSVAPVSAAIRSPGQRSRRYTRAAQLRQRRTQRQEHQRPGAHCQPFSATIGCRLFVGGLAFLFIGLALLRVWLFLLSAISNPALAYSLGFFITCIACFCCILLPLLQFWNRWDWRQQRREAEMALQELHEAEAADAERIAWTLQQMRILRSAVEVWRALHDPHELQRSSGGLTSDQIGSRCISRTYCAVDTLKETEDDLSSCSICLADYCDSEMVLQLPCGHEFHESCATQWLYLNDTCPLCKSPVLDSSTSGAMMEGDPAGAESELALAEEVEDMDQLV